MKHHFLSIPLIFVAAFSTALSAQTQPHQRHLDVNGHTGMADVIDQDGRLFVDVAALATVAKGSVNSSTSEIVLSIPAATSRSTKSDTAPPAEASEQASSTSLSPQFMRAAIEEIACLREWSTTLASAVRGGYGITDEWVNGYRDTASQNLQVASAAILTDGDRSAAQLLHAAFNLTQQFSDHLVAAKKSMDTAKYAISPNALREEPLSQKLIACGHFMTQMLGSATFQDDGSCH